MQLLQQTIGNMNRDTGLSMGISHRLLRFFAEWSIMMIGCWLLFNAVFFLGTHPTKAIDSLFQWSCASIWKTLPDSLGRDFLVHGLLTGIAGFAVYVPNIVLMFLFANLLFYSNLTHRAGQITAPLLNRLGLPSNSFTALLFGFGCSVNALQAARLMENKKERLVTMLVAPFMSCGSKAGVYMLIVSVLFTTREAGTVLLLLYLTGITTAIVSSWLMRMLLRIKRPDSESREPSVSLRLPEWALVAKKNSN